MNLGDLDVRHENGARVYAFNVKVDRMLASAEVFVELADELELTGKKIADPRDADAPPLGFDREWAETWAEENPELFALGPQAWAVDSGGEAAEEAAEELFGKGAKVYGTGRSGGWLWIKGAPTPGEMEDAESALAEVSRLRGVLETARAAGLTDGAAEFELELSDAIEALPMTAERFAEKSAALVEFARRATEYVRDEIPRSIAWNLGANVFVRLAEEYATSRLEIERTLVVSTAHLSIEDRDHLYTLCSHPLVIGPVVYEHGEYGWDVRTAEEPGDMMSENLAALLAFARRATCEWIRFDADGPVVEGLATFPDQEPEPMDDPTFYVVRVDGDSHYAALGAAPTLAEAIAAARNGAHGRRVEYRKVSARDESMARLWCERTAGESWTEVQS